MRALAVETAKVQTMKVNADAELLPPRPREHRLEEALRDAIRLLEDVTCTSIAVRLAEIERLNEAVR